MNYLILFAVLSTLFITIKSFKIILKAAKRINLVYDYFIVSREVTSQDLDKMTEQLKNRPDPNDNGGCPTEEELTNEQ